MTPQAQILSMKKLFGFTIEAPLQNAEKNVM